MIAISTYAANGRGQRVMESVKEDREAGSKLKVNEGKSAVAKPQEWQVSGIQLYRRTRDQASNRAKSPWSVLNGESERLHDVQRASASMRRSRNWPHICGAGAAIPASAKLLASSCLLLAGSVHVFAWHFGGNGKQPIVVGQLSWALGVRPKLASNTASSSRGPWYLAHAKALSVALPTAYFKSLALPNLEDATSVTISNRRVRTRTHGGVQGSAGNRCPYADQTR